MHDVAVMKRQSRRTPGTDILRSGQRSHRPAIKEEAQLLGTAAVGMEVHTPVPKVLIFLYNYASALLYLHQGRQ